MTHTILLVIMIVALLCACTIRVEPLGYKPKTKHVVVHHKKHGRHHGSEAAQVVVDPTWVNAYHQLQQEHGNYTIPDDSRIQYTKDGKVKVPLSVVKHFHDLNKTPKPPPDVDKLNEQDR